MARLFNAPDPWSENPALLASLPPFTHPDDAATLVIEKRDDGGRGTGKRGRRQRAAAAVDGAPACPARRPPVTP